MPPSFGPAALDNVDLLSDVLYLRLGFHRHTETPTTT
jgi:hypothetical protein